MSHNLRKLALVAACLAFAAPLAVYAWLGAAMRLSGDDYCYSMSLTQYGFWRAQVLSYLSATVVAGNRYALTFFSGLSTLPGAWFNGALPGLTIALWAGGACLAFSRLLHDRLEALMAALALVFLALYQAPDLPQVLYWRSGMLPYLAPLVALAWGLALWLRWRPSKRRCEPRALALFALALVAGGFSETGTLVLLAAWGLALLVSAARRERRAAGLALAALLGALAGLGLLVFSPATAQLIANRGRLAPSLAGALAMSLRFALAFVIESLRGLALPSAVTLLLGIVLALVWQPPAGLPYRQASPARLLGWALAVMAAAFALVTAVMAASAYAQSGYPEPRALFPARVALVLAWALLGWLLGRGLAGLAARFNGQRVLPGRALAGVALVALLALSLYPLRAAARGMRQSPASHAWARTWDARDAAMRAAAAQGQRDLRVPALDHIIPRVGDLSSDPAYWYNRCASNFYDVDTIQAGP